MDGTEKMETLSSAAAFVEGGIQDACDDSCSICLEAFCDSDPSTVTGCKHEFHLQCILEWCQRSSQCPMCWQPISLKDPTSQELLEAVERERNLRFNPSRNTTIFHHPTLGDFELQHVGANDTELEERIIQHLAAAAAMGRPHHVARRDGQRSRSAAHGHPQFLVFSSHPNAPPVGPVSASSGQRMENDSPTAITGPSPSDTLSTVGEEPQHQHQVSRSTPVIQVPMVPNGTTVTSARISNNRNFAGQSTPSGEDRAGPSDFQTFSESLKSRFNAVSTRFKDSITKSTRGWKERLFSRNTSITDIGSVDAGMATVSCVMERLDTRENSSSSSSNSVGVSISHSSEGNSIKEPSNQMNMETGDENLPTDTNASVSCAAVSDPK